MKVSFYIHAWQGVLMFLIGIVCVLASFLGYVLSGGGEELLRRALWNKVPSGKVSYKALDFNWKANRIEATDVSHEDFSWPKEKPVARLSNVAVPKLSVQLEGWPARVESITVEGMRGASIDVTEGFLQEGKLPESKPLKDLPRIHFVDCDLNVKFGGASLLTLSGCRGELARDNEDRLHGAFSVKQLNGKPFDVSVETLGDGRWVISGHNIQIDTRTALPAAKNPFASKLDPVGLLIKSLFGGDLGAEGTLTSLHISVQPETSTRTFSCDGEVGYSNITFKLPPAEDKSSEALPFLVGMLLGADDMVGATSWLKVDQIIAGAPGQRGRLAFHMSDGKLDFYSDEGSGSALTGARGGKRLPPLESLKGTVETDEASQPKRMMVRGFLGPQLSFETRLFRNEDRSRSYEVVVEPRPGTDHLEFGRPLWRFETHVTDYVSVKDRAPELSLADFQVEANSRGFPLIEWLPPGLKQFSGRFHAKGSFFNLNANPKEGRLVRLDEARLDDGAKIVYGGAERQNLGAEFHPFWEAVYALFATTQPWTIVDLSMKGDAEILMDENLQWNKIKLSRWVFDSGNLAHDGTLTSFAVPDLKLSGEFTRDVAKETKDGEFRLNGVDWNTSLKGKWVHDGSKAPGGEFQYAEENVPLRLHPLRETLKALGQAPNDRVNRSFSVRVQGDGVKVDKK